MKKIISTCLLVATLFFCLDNQAQQAQKKTDPVTIEITNYNYELFSGTARDGSVASIELYQSNRQRGTIVFFPASKTLPKADYDTKTKMMTLYYSIDMLEYVTNFLESDKEIKIKYDPKTETGSFIAMNDNRTPTDPRKDGKASDANKVNNSSVKKSSNVRGTNSVKIPDARFNKSTPKVRVGATKSKGN